jgi:hypothetical protein
MPDANRVQLSPIDECVLRWIFVAALQVNDQSALERSIRHCNVVR